METALTHNIAPTQPTDSSIEAYKVWIRQIAARLTTGAIPINLTEQEWHKSWREYWDQKRARKTLSKT